MLTPEDLQDIVDMAKESEVKVLPPDLEHQHSFKVLSRKPGLLVGRCIDCQKVKMFEYTSKEDADALVETWKAMRRLSHLGVRGAFLPGDSSVNA